MVISCQSWSVAHLSLLAIRNSRHRRELYRFRQLYLIYPEIVETLSPQSLPGGPDLIHRLAFSHLSEQLELTDETQRRFYEIECIRGNWSVRELRRQIASLYYERSGLSKNKVKSKWSNLFFKRPAPFVLKEIP